MSQSSSGDANSAPSMSSDLLVSVESALLPSNLETTLNPDSSDKSSPIAAIDSNRSNPLPDIAMPDLPMAQFRAGQFTVAATGTVLVALSTSTPKVGEAALFSLVGMETLEPGSPEFVQEAIRRSLSHSALGCILNRAESEQTASPEVYQHQITLEPGTQFALMWARTQTIAALQSSEIVEPSELVFSIPAANTQSITRFGQFTNSNGDVLFGFVSPQFEAVETPALEVVSLYLVGATGEAAPINFAQYAAEAWGLTDQDIKSVSPRIAAAVRFPIAVDTNPLLSERVALSNLIDLDQLMPATAIEEIAAKEAGDFNSAAVMPMANFATAMSFTTPAVSRVNIVWRNYTTGVNELWVVENEQVVRRVSLPFTPPGDWRLQGCIDMTQDGYADLLWQHSQGGGIVVWQMQGAASVAAYNISPVVTDANWQVVGAADFNRDGRPELLWRHRLSGETLYWVLDAAGRNAVSSVSLPPVDSGWQIQAVGSFTGTGSTDLLWRNPSSGQNVYWSVNGTQIQSGLLPNLLGSEWQIQGCADFNGDGKADILWRNVNTGETAVWIMNGTQQVRNLRLPDQSVLQDWRAIVPFVWDAPQPSIQLQLANDTGASGNNTDQLTSDPTIRGQITAQQNIKQLLIRLVPSSTSIDITSSIQADKTFTITLAQLQQLNNGQPLLDSTYTIEATLLDVHHHPSNPATLTFTLDRTAPTTITIDLPDAQDTGSSTTDNITRNRTVTVVGTAEPGMQIELRVQGAVIATTTAAANGTWQATVTRPTDGVQAISAVAIDAAGNRTATPATLNVTIDSAAPQITLTTPTQFPLTQASRLTGSVNGTGSAIASVIYRFGNLTSHTIATNVAGAFDQVFNLSGVTNGNHTLTITATDVAGNSTSAQWQVTVAIDANAPVITVSLQRDTALNNGTNQDSVTFDPTIVGTVIDANRVDAFEARFSNTAAWSNVLPQRQANGAFILNRAQLAAINGGALNDGTYTLQLRARDQFNYIGSASITFTLDTHVQAPQNLQLAASSDSGSNSSDRITYVQTPTITGTAEPNVLVQIRQNAATIASTQANSNGNWQVTLPALSNGTHTVVAVAIDAAGNTSAASNGLTIQVDAQAPISPTLTLAPTSDTGKSNTDRITNRAALAVTGSAEANAIIKLFCNDVQVQQVLATPAGTWQATLASLPDGVHRLTAIAVDVAGNESPASIPVEVQIDTVAPEPPQNLRLSSAINSTLPQQTNNRVLSIEGEAISHATVQLLQNGQAVGSITADALGKWKTSIAVAADGSYSFSAIAEDTAGNQSVASTALVVAVDATAPVLTLTNWDATAPITPQTRLTGRAIDVGAGLAAVRYQIGNQPQRTLTLSPDGSFDQTLDLTGISAGSQTLRIVAQDAVGNETVQTFSITITPTQVNPEPLAILLRMIDAQNRYRGHDATFSRPIIAGWIVGASDIAEVEASFDGIQFTKITSLLDDQGYFRFDATQLSALYGQAFSEQQYQFQIRATNAAGIASESNLRFVVDLTAPLPAATNLANVKTLSSEDRLNGVLPLSNEMVWLTYRFNGQDEQEIWLDQTNGQFDLPFEFEGVEPGKHTVTLTRRDEAGNEAEQSFVIYVEDDAPFGDDLIDLDDVGLLVGSGYGYGSGGSDVFETDGPGDPEPNDPNDPTPPPPPNPPFPPPPNDPPDPPGDPHDILYNRNSAISYVRAGKNANLAYGEYVIRAAEGEVVSYSMTAFRFLSDVWLAWYYDLWFDADPPEPNPEPPNLGSSPPPLPDPDQPRLTYLERLRSILRRAIRKLGGQKRTALAEQEAALYAIGTWFYQNDQLHPAARHVGAYGVYELALNAITRLRTTEAGDTLTDAVRNEKATVQSQVFPAKLVGAALKVQDPKIQTLMRDQSLRFVFALNDLATLYAKAIKRIAPETAAEQPISCLRTIWLAKSESALLVGAEALRQALAEVADPLRAIKLAHRLLQAAGQIAAWKDQLRDPNFVDGLVNLAIEYSKLDPVFVSQRPFNAFLNTLSQEWVDVRQGARELYQFFEPFSTPELRLQMLKFSRSLLETARKVDAMKETRQNPKVINHLLGLGREYGAIISGEAQPIAQTFAATTTNEEDPKLFLNTLWNAETEQDVQKGIDEFRDYLDPVGLPATDIKTGRRKLIITDAIKDDDLKQVVSDVKFLKKVVSSARTHTSFIATISGPMVEFPSDPLALISIHKFIQMVKEVEAGYSRDTPDQIVTRLRRLYYPGINATFETNQAFDRLIPNADNFENYSVISGVQGSRSRVVSTSKEAQRAGDKGVSNETYRILTAKANENTQYGNASGDNPSPYLVLNNSSKDVVDIGHLLLTYDALRHPGAGEPYLTYDVPNIDPASWIADIGIGAVWLQHQVEQGKAHKDAPKDFEGITLSNPPTEKQINFFYNASAPEPDILGDVDGYGLFMTRGNGTRPLSEQLEAYYLGLGGETPGVSNRWKTFRIINHLSETLAFLDVLKRVDRFNTLYGDGGVAAFLNAAFKRSPFRNWRYAPTMVGRFLIDVHNKFEQESGEKS